MLWDSSKFQNTIVGIQIMGYYWKIINPNQVLYKNDNSVDMYSLQQNLNSEL